MLCAGAFFFLAGTVGLLRFPDSLTRLHALTKADNLGLGLIVLGLLPRRRIARCLEACPGVAARAVVQRHGGATHCARGAAQRAAIMTGVTAFCDRTCRPAPGDRGLDRRRPHGLHCDRRVHRLWIVAALVWVACPRSTWL